MREGMEYGRISPRVVGGKEGKGTARTDLPELCSWLAVCEPRTASGAKLMVSDDCRLLLSRHQLLLSRSLL